MRYVAFLRGINVGGKNKVDMAVVRDAVEATGAEDVATYLNTGNIVFSAPRAKRSAVEERLRASIADAVGFDVPVLVRTAAEVDALLHALPPSWDDDERQRCYVFFLTAEDRDPDVPYRADIEEVLHVPGAFVWRIDRANINRSWIRKLFGTELYGRASSRNLTTVKKVAALAR